MNPSVEIATEIRPAVNWLFGTCCTPCSSDLSCTDVHNAPTQTKATEIRPNSHMRPVFHSPSTSAAMSALVTIWPAVDSGMASVTPICFIAVNCPADPTAQNRPENKPTTQMRGFST